MNDGGNEMSVTKTVFGKTKAGEEVALYTIENSGGMKISCIDYGAILVNVITLSLIHI